MTTTRSTTVADVTVMGVSMMKDEADIAYDVVMHLVSEGLSTVLVADNGSTDGTRDELLRAAMEAPTWGAEVVIVDDDEPGYYQSVKMTELAREAGARGATWIVPFDADEIWFGHGDRLAQVLDGLPERINVARAPLYNHWGTSYDHDGVSVFRGMPWHEPHPGALPKVAFRWHPDVVVHQGNHGVSFGDHPQFSDEGVIEVRHFPWRNSEQFIRKVTNGAAAYAATDLDASQGAHWRQYGAILDKFGPDVLVREVYHRHFLYGFPEAAGLICDPAPFRRWG